MLLPSGAAVPKPLRKAPAGVGTRDPRDQRGQRARVPQAALSRGGPSKRAVDARAICAATVNAQFILAGGEAIESPRNIVTVSRGLLCATSGQRWPSVPDRSRQAPGHGSQPAKSARNARPAGEKCTDGHRR